MSELNKIEIVDSLEGLPKQDWGLDALNVKEAWIKSKGEGTKVAVIDTGIDMSHPDLTYNIRGKINMFEKSHDVSDEYGHGTHVAGLIAGKNTGVAPNAELYIAKVLDKDGFGSMAHVLDGITFAINYEVDILCMSLGSPYEIPLILQERITQAYNNGITIVCATGNSGRNQVQYPAFMEEVIAVGGVDKDFNRAKFSNHGKQLDIMAPAVSILSTFKDNNYARITGTSTASPLIAGAIALIISYNRKQGKNLKPRDIKDIISALGEHNYEYGHGVMDLNKLMDLK